MSDSGNYTCTYQAQVSGRWIRSHQSEPLGITLTRPPPQPKVSRHPEYPIYVAGETVTITCAVSNRDSAERFQLVKGSTSVMNSTRNRQPLTYTIKSLTRDNEGSYLCFTQMQVSGRWIHSPSSPAFVMVVTNPPPPPTISMNPDIPVYLPGESVTITCRVPRGTSPGGFQLLKDSNLLKNITSNEPSLSFPIRNVTSRSEGSYMCLSQIQLSGRWIHSPSSNIIRISLTDTRPPPTITVIPEQPVYVSGETVTITCEVPHGESAGRFQLLKDSIAVVESTRSQRSLTYLIRNMTASQGGSYTCSYQIQMAGRWLPSDLSIPIQINITDVPPQPTISKHPESPVYVAGETVTIVCRAPPGYTTGRLQLLKALAPVIDSTRGQETLNYTVRHLSTSNEGDYTCAYQTQLWGRWIDSSPSQPITITIAHAPAVPRILVNPAYPVYMTGESVAINCAVPNGNPPGRLRMLKDGATIISGQVEQNGPSLTYSSRYVTRENEGSYTCLHEIELFGRWIHSAANHAVQINVTDVPPPPTVSLSPTYPVYLSGEDVRIACVVPARYDFSRLRWSLRWSEGNVTTEIQTTHDPVANSFGTVDRNGDGNYTCLYEREVAGRWIPSLPSESVTVHRLAVRAVISMDHQSGRYVEGSIATISCSDPDWNHVNSFTFYKDSALLHSLDAVSGHHFVSLTIGNISEMDQGSYTCKCGITVLGRHLSSHASNSMLLTVEEMLKPVISIDSDDVDIGGNLSITCMNMRDHPGVSFFIQRVDDVSSSRFRPVLLKDNIAIFTVTNVTQGDGGVYSCGYEVMANGTVVAYTISERVEVTVNAKSWTQLLTRYLYVTGVAVLIVVVAVAVAIKLKKKKGSANLNESTEALNVVNPTSTKETTL
ncbi:immunoglobulin superfamily member 1-like [Mustelus asterias]